MVKVVCRHFKFVTQQGEGKSEPLKIQYPILYPSMRMCRGKIDNEKRRQKGISSILCTQSFDKCFSFIYKHGLVKLTDREQ
jgi:hypothetical protein